MKYAKYTTAIQLMDDCINAAPDEVHAKWDTLYEHIFAGFAAPETSYVTDVEIEHELALCIHMFMIPRGGALLERIKAIPPLFVDIIFPVALARYMLRDMNVPVSSSKLKTFPEFYKRYARMVFGCYEKIK